MRVTHFGDFQYMGRQIVLIASKGSVLILGAGLTVVGTWIGYRLTKGGPHAAPAAPPLEKPDPRNPDTDSTADE